MCETFNAVNKKFEEEDAASEDVDIIGNSVLRLQIHMKTLRIVWGSDEAVREEQKQNPARQNKKCRKGLCDRLRARRNLTPEGGSLLGRGSKGAQPQKWKMNAPVDLELGKSARKQPTSNAKCAPQSHAGRWLSSQKRAARGHSHRSGG